jgi:hypothetical protein
MSTGAFFVSLIEPIFFKRSIKVLELALVDLHVYRFVYYFQF